MSASKEQLAEWRAKAVEFHTQADKAKVEAIRKAYADLAESYDRLIAAEERILRMKP